MANEDATTTDYNKASTEKKANVEYPSNSHKDRDKEPEDKDERKPKSKKVISGDVVKKKKSLGRKVADTFTGDDMKTVGEHILFDMIIPGAKDLLVDIIKEGVERKFYGESYRGGPRRSFSSGSSRNVRTDYNGAFRPNREDRPSGPPTMSQRGRATHNFDEIVIANRGEAEYVLSQLYELLREYDVVTVADLYDLVGVTGNFTDEKWGWTDLTGARVRPVGGGFLLQLPRTTYLD